MKRWAPYVVGGVGGWWAIDQWGAVVLLWMWAGVGVLATATQMLKAWNDRAARRDGVVVKHVVIGVKVTDTSAWCPSCGLPSGIAMTLVAEDNDGGTVSQMLYCTRGQAMVPHG